MVGCMSLNRCAIFNINDRTANTGPWHLMTPASGDDTFPPG
jgi:hypothetical protein